MPFPSGGRLDQSSPLCHSFPDGFTYRIRDLGSRNGTFVNEHQIKSDVVLVPDDRIRIGSMMMQLALKSESKPAPGQINSLNQTDFIDGTTISVPSPSSLPDNDTKKEFRLPDSAPDAEQQSERKTG
ncbi:MAG: FHA domain-containing protein [Planctomycetaceae bacterium]